MSIAALLPTGALQQKSNVRTQIEGGESLVFRMKWSVALRDPNILHEQWLYSTEKVENYHPRIAAFQEDIDNIKLKSRGVSDSVAQIPMLFPFVPKIMENFNLDWDGSDELVVYCTIETLAEPEIEEEEINTVRVNKSTTEKAGQHGIIPTDTASY